MCSRLICKDKRQFSLYFDATMTSALHLIYILWVQTPDITISNPWTH